MWILCVLSPSFSLQWNLLWWQAEELSIESTVQQKLLKLLYQFYDTCLCVTLTTRTISTQSTTNALRATLLLYVQNILMIKWTMICTLFISLGFKREITIETSLGPKGTKCHHWCLYSMQLHCLNIYIANDGNPSDFEIYKIVIIVGLLSRCCNDYSHSIRFVFCIFIDW